MQFPVKSGRPDPKAKKRNLIGNAIAGVHSLSKKISDYVTQQRAYLSQDVYVHPSKDKTEKLCKHQ